MEKGYSKNLSIKDMKKRIPFIAFGITDEIFSVASFTKEQVYGGVVHE